MQLIMYFKELVQRLLTTQPFDNAFGGPQTFDGGQPSLHVPPVRTATGKITQKSFLKTSNSGDF